ncbi:MAG: tetratricopeptide repeat protein [Acetilactobacillus jinshanensis]
MNYSQKALMEFHHQKLKGFKANYILALHHDSDDDLYALASQLYNVGFSVQAKRIFLKLLKKYPNEDELKSDLAEIAIDDGQDNKALNYLSQVKPGSPDYVQSLMVAADLYQTQGLLGVSLQKLLTAKKIAPHEDVLTFALAELYFTMRRYNDAIPLYLHMIKKGIPEYAEVNLVERIGVAYANAGMFNHAIGYLKQIDLKHSSPDTQFETAFTYLQLNDYEKAAQGFKQLHQRDDQYATLYPYWGDTLTHLHLNKEALKIYQEGLRVDQYNEKLWAKAGDAAIREEKPKLAEKYYLKGHHIAPDNLIIAVKYSNLLVQARRYHENVKFLADYVKDDNLDPRLLWNLATSYRNLHDFKNASGYYHHAESYFADVPSFLKEAGLFYREAGKMKESDRLLKLYVKQVPNDIEMQNLLDEDQ